MSDIITNRLVITIEPASDGDGYNVDAVSILEKRGKIRAWHWAGWSETAKRAAEYATSEWEFARSK